MKPLSAQSPFAQCRYYPYWGDVYAASCKDITPRSSLLRTHSPIPSGSSFLQPWPRVRSLRRLLPAPAATGIFPTLSLRIFPRMLGPLPRRSHGVRLPVSSSVSSAFPREDWVGFPLLSANTTSRGSCFRGCRHSFMFRPPSLLVSQAVPTAAHSTAGQLRLLHPGRTCFVASARTGFAREP